MCGIAGFVTSGFEQLTVQHLTLMGDAIAHRGPDQAGTYLDNDVGLCHRRLSILDLSEAGRQPMHSHCGRYLIVFNGEIYNFQTLRQGLIDQGVEFHSSTDTEVILALYARKGRSCIEDLNGMFAFALWDKQDRSLWMARDRLGKKPFYYYLTENHDGTVQQFAFASEIKALLALTDIRPGIRVDAVYDFMAYQYIPDPKTIFTSIHKLPPGHEMLMHERRLTQRAYWDLQFSSQPNRDEEAAKTQLFDKLKEATKLRMVSDVSLGAFLSGGVDSSGVVALMSSLSDDPIKTCTVGFDEARFDETTFAELVAKQYGTDHRVFTADQNVADNLERIVAYFDEPFADPSLVPTYFVSELAKREVTVAIAGDGGDEVFAGYQKYQVDAIENQWRNACPQWLRSTLIPLAAQVANWAYRMTKIPVLKKAHTLLYSLSVEPAMGFYLTNSMITDAQWNDLVNDQTRSALGKYHPSRVTLDAYHRAAGDHLAKILYTDTKTYLPGGILVKVDRMSMANSLEVRAPILDYQIVEFAASLDSNLKYRRTVGQGAGNGEKKYVLKEAFKPLLSDDTLYRKKMGFSVPLAEWLRNELKQKAHEHLITHARGIPQFFNTETVAKWWRQHQANEDDHATVLWSLLMFELWYKRWYEVTVAEGAP